MKYRHQMMKPLQISPRKSKRVRPKEATTASTITVHLAPYTVCGCFGGPGVIAAIITHRHHARTVWRAHCPAGYYSSSIAYYRASKITQLFSLESMGRAEAAQCAT